MELSGGVAGYDPRKSAGDCVFDVEAAHKALEFFRCRLRHVKGERARQPFELRPWQAAVVACVFGWKRPDGTRRFREVFVYVPKKNGKTTLAAGLVVYLLAEDHEPGAEIYSAACSRDQAGQVFAHAAGMVRQNAELSSRLQVFGLRGGSQLKSIVNEEEMSSYKALAADASTADGANVHAAVIDELHRHPTPDLADILQKSTAARRQPLVVYLTTADYDRPDSICNRKWAYASQVRDGVVNDPSFFPVIFEAKKTDDWTDPAVWEKANPNFGVTVPADFYVREVAKAKEDISTQNDFKRLHLNIITEQATAAIEIGKWDACAGLAEGETALTWRSRLLDELAGRECLGGLDLGSTSDLTALCLLFDVPDKGYLLLPWFWMPREGLRKKDPAHARLYESWIAEGWITPTAGNVADYDQIRADIGGIAGKFGVKELAVDRLFQGAQLCSQLMADGMNLVAFGQGFMSMAAPTKLFLEDVLSARVTHGANPVLRWMASNLMVLRDAAGNVKPAKNAKDNQRKIDGIVAAIMALGRRMVAEPPGSVYDKQGVTFI